MSNNYYHGRGFEGLTNIAETGTIKGSEITEDELFPALEDALNGEDKAIWITPSQSCAEVYAWGGGYLELETEELEVIEDENSPYAVILQQELTIDRVERIMIEERPNSAKEFASEIEELLQEEDSDIPVGTYEGETYEISPGATAD